MYVPLVAWALHFEATADPALYEDVRIAQVLPSVVFDAAILTFLLAVYRKHRMPPARSIGPVPDAGTS